MTDIQYNGQKKDKDKRRNNGLQIITQKTKEQQQKLKSEGELNIEDKHHGGNNRA